jgi:pimeloyl-ACP methyl ester carboxylesterase
MPYVELDGIDTYYEIHGSGEPVLLLHGGFCSAETLREQARALATSYTVHVPERPGQGRTADREGPMTYDDMVRDTLAYLDALQVAAAHLVGFSDGAITGLLLARDHPDRVLSLVAISGNLDPDGFVVGDTEESTEEAPDDGTWAAIREAYDRLSPDGPEHGDVVLEKLAAMWQTEPHIDPTTLASVRAPTLVLAGERDSIRTDHTIGIARAIRGGQVGIVPGAGHMVMQERPALVNLILSEFLASASGRGGTR